MLNKTAFRHNDKGAAVISAKVGTDISPSKPIRVRLFSAPERTHSLTKEWVLYYI